mgnify:CR=1 FL=1|jgi:hypothetical protein
MYFYLMFLSVLSYLTYVYRINIFLYYCELSEYYDLYNNKQKNTIQKNKCFRFNHNNHSTIEICSKQYFEKDINDFLTIMEINERYIIYPNKSIEPTQSPFIICEVILNNKHYDITNILKLFYIKNNIILTRPFIIYIFYNYLNTKIQADDTYAIKYINTDINAQIINSDTINIYEYTI